MKGDARPLPGSGRPALAMLAAAAAALALLAWLSCLYLGGDEGSYFYEAGLIRNGKVLMRDFVGRAPALMALLALHSRMAGDGLVALKLFNIAVVALIAALVHAMVRRHRPPAVAALAALVVLLNPTFLLTKLVLNTTALGILFTLLGCHLLLRDAPRAFAAGMALALAVFTREINAFFVAALLVHLLLAKRWRLLVGLSVGGGLVSAVFIGYFTSQIGLAATLRTLLGLGHVGAVEARVLPAYSLPKFVFFLASIAPLAALLALVKEDRGSGGRVALLRIYLFVTSAFYAAYTFKRGFILSYGSELVPFLVVVVFVTRDVAAARRAPIGIALAAPLLLFAAVAPARGTGPSAAPRLPLDALIGSGIPRSTVDAVNAVIRGTTDPGETILAGSPMFASANGRRQFMEITRPLIYEGESTLDAMYGAPSREEIIRRFDAEKPPVVVLTSHLDASLWRTTGLRDIVTVAYVSAFADPYAEVFVRKDVYQRRKP